MINNTLVVQQNATRKTNSTALQWYLNTPAAMYAYCLHKHP